MVSPDSFIYPVDDWLLALATLRCLLLLAEGLKACCDGVSHAVFMFGPRLLPSDRALCVDPHCTAEARGNSSAQAGSRVLTFEKTK